VVITVVIIKAYPARPSWRPQAVNCDIMIAKCCAAMIIIIMLPIKP
jgi:hypothetical protein